nr:ArsA-related P-loop ATPase [Streptomyces zingiberis]
MLVTGPGGAGRTTAAAASALAAARGGRRVLLLTTGAPGVLDALIGVALPPPAPVTRPTAAPVARTGPAGPAGASAGRGPVAAHHGPGAPWTAPVPAAPGLWAARIDGDAALRERLFGLQERAATALDLLGAAPLDRDELAVLPGSPGLALLRALRAVRALPPAPPLPGPARPPAAETSPAPASLPATGAGADGGHRGAVPSSVPSPGADPRPGAVPARITAGSAAAAASGSAPAREAAGPRPPGAVPGDGGAGPHPAVPETWDLVVVDLPPAAEALALLALPERFGWYLDRLLPPRRQAARALRPVLARLAGVPMPPPWLYEAAGRIRADLTAVTGLLDASTTTLRLVAEPGPAAVDALRRLRPGLALHGHRVDAVIAGKVLPTGSADPWLASLSGAQQSALKTLRADWAGTGGGTVLRELPHLGREPRGPGDLAALAAALGPLADAPWPDGPVAAGPAWAGGPVRAEAENGAAGHAGAVPAPGPVAGAGHRPVEDRRAAEGVLIWRIPLPGTEREEVELVRRGDELIVVAGGFRRMLPLPSALRRCTVSGAGLSGGELRVRFVPEPGLWPTAR